VRGEWCVVRSEFEAFVARQARSSRNSPNDAGRMIESMGLKGFRVGAA
jgi:UDP-N-acetylenolpyruvoylglucosamine reductase